MPDKQKYAVITADIVGSVDWPPCDLSTLTKKYLKSTGYGDKRTR